MSDILILSRSIFLLANISETVSKKCTLFENNLVSKIDSLVLEYVKTAANNLYKK